MKLDSARERSDKFHELLPDARERSIEVGRGNVEVGNEKPAFGVQPVDGGFDEGIEGEPSTVLCDGVAGNNIVKDVAALEGSTG